MDLYICYTQFSFFKTFVYTNRLLFFLTFSPYPFSISFFNFPFLHSKLSLSYSAFLVLIRIFWYQVCPIPLYLFQQSIIRFRLGFYLSLFFNTLHLFAIISPVFPHFYSLSFWFSFCLGSGKKELEKKTIRMKV